MNAPDRYYVLGNPVAHSQSPFIHAAFAAQTGQNMRYDRRQCPMDGFEEAVRALAADRDGGPVRGCNVTVPFKFRAAELARVVTPRATLAGAANVLRFDEDGWLADNTDGIGLLHDIECHLETPLRGLSVLLAGAGGAGAGVLGPLIDAGPSRVVVCNRSAERADELVGRHAALARAAGVDLAAQPMAAPGLAFDLVINATASSLSGQTSPVPRDVLREGTLAIDLMYGAAAQPFLAWAAASGARTSDGLGMLVEQAAEAFWLFRGVRPQTAPVLKALRERLAASS